MNGRIAACIALAGLACSGLNAQVVLPPEDPPPPFKNIKYQPPQMDPAVREALERRWLEAQRDAEIRKQEREEQSRREREGARRRPTVHDARTPEELLALELAQERIRLMASFDGVEYESMIVADDDGVIMGYRLPYDEVALYRNPLLDDQTRQAAYEVIAQRRHAMERMAVENLDLIEIIDRGEFNRASVADRPALARYRSIGEVFSPAKSLGEELLERGILSIEQEAFNARIVSEYEAAFRKNLLEVARKDQDGQRINPVDSMIRYYLNHPVKEATLAYEGLLLRLGGRLGEVADLISLNDEQQSVVNEAARIAHAGDDDTRIAQARKALAAISFRQRQRLLMMIHEMR